MVQLGLIAALGGAALLGAVVAVLAYAPLVATPLWTAAPRGGGPNGEAGFAGTEPLVSPDGGSLYLHDSWGLLLKLDAAHGTTLWRNGTRVGGGFSSPAFMAMPPPLAAATAWWSAGATAS